MTIETTARNAEIGDLMDKLEKLHECQLDAVVPAQAMRSQGALIHVKGMSVFQDEIVVRPTAIMDGHIAERLSIPVKYVRRMRDERPDLYDANFNGWIHGFAGTFDESIAAAGPDGRSFLLRTFTDPEGGEGVGRCLMSDSYGIIDHLDALVATLKGISDSGVETALVSSDLSETRMHLRFAAPGIAALAPVLLDGYNPPVDGWGNLDRIREVAKREGMDYEPGKEPVVFAGFDVDNSETGSGACQVTPIMMLEACKNGLRINALAMRKIHVGAKLEPGVIQWSPETQQKAIDLVQAQTADVVRSFLDIDFLRGQLEEVEKKAGKVLEDPGAAVEFVAKKLSFTDEQRKGILDHFIKGSQMTAGGVVNAITSYSQTVGDPDEAFALDNVALEALDLVGS